VIDVTADTNVYISALNFAGLPRQFLMDAMAGRFRSAISEPILAEIRAELRAKFSWSDATIEETVALLASCTTLVRPKLTLDVVPDDPDDNRIVECALKSGSKFIVTGDADLLRLAVTAASGS
jgi:putative PIN family toxin of toxin-antitoxin system